MRTPGKFALRLFCIQANKAAQYIGDFLHILRTDELEFSVHICGTCADIRAGQPLKGKPGSVRTAADGRYLGVTPQACIALTALLIRCICGSIFSFML